MAGTSVVIQKNGGRAAACPPFFLYYIVYILASFDTPSGCNFVFCHLSSY